MSNKIQKPYIRLRHDGSGVYECSACLAKFHGPGGRKGLITEFANHVRETHLQEAEKETGAGELRRKQ